MPPNDGTSDAASPPGGGGSGVSAPGQHVELTIADVEKIGQDTAALTSRTEAARTQLNDARGDKSAFGSYAPAQSLAAQHDAVVRVFEDTLALMTSDMDDFGHTIVQAAHNHAQTDDNVLAAFLHVGSTVQPNALRGGFDKARDQAGYDLTDLDSDLDSSDEVTDMQVAHPEIDQDIAAQPEDMPPPDVSPFDALRPEGAATTSSGTSTGDDWDGTGTP